MIHVILDTNILDRSPHRSNAAFHALQKLCEDGRIQLHLPDVVQREFLSHREEAIDEGIQSIVRGIKKLNKEKVAKQLQFTKLFTPWENGLEELKTQFINTTHEEFSQWMDHLHIRFHKIAPHHGEAVLHAYFEGNPPFKGARNKGIRKQKEIRRREEFADAFIWQTILDLLHEYKQVHFISNNKKDFHKICEETSGVVLYSSLEDFLTSPLIKDLFLEQFTERHFETILEILRQKEAQMLPKFIQAAYETFSMNDQFIIEDLIADPEVEISGWGYSGKDKWKAEIHYEQARHFGYGMISLPIAIELERFNLSYYKTIHTIPQPLPPNTQVHYSYEHGVPPTLDTEEYFPLKLYTSVDLFLLHSESLQPEKIPDMITHADIHVEQIENVEVDQTRRERYDYII